MTKPVTTTRRGFVGGAAALLPLGSIALAPGTAAAALPQNRADLLAGYLDGLDLPLAPSHLSLLSYQETAQTSGMFFRVVIRLTWPPGERTRLITAQAHDHSSGLLDLLKQAQITFATRAGLGV